MDDLIQIRGGEKCKAALRERELGYNIAEKALYVGTENGNVKLCRAEDIGKIEGKLTATPAASQASLKDDAQIGEVITAWNNLISALKGCGVMKTE